jgi:hypothetical protein
MENRDMALGGILIAILALLLLGLGILGPPPGEPPGGGDIPPGGIPCTMDGDCPPGMVCIGGFCDYPPDECTDDLDCPSGVCINGVCEDECTDDSDCPDGEICVNGECEEDNSCTSDFDCPSGVCVNGVCEDECSDDLDCPSGVCVNGVCEDECSDDLDCPEGECINGVCVTECDDDLDCPEGECINGVCISGCDEDSDCPEGEICVNGECEEEDECSVDGDCPDGFECTGGECTEIPPECETEADCEEGEVCDPETGECVPAGEVGAPETFCEGCPSEDSLVTRMFLDPDIPNKQISAVIFAEVGTQRLAIEDATIFAQVIAKESGDVENCKMLTDQNGQVSFDYSEKEVCRDEGCLIRIVFCCADVGDGCLLPVCLDDPSIDSHTDIPACEDSAGSWTTRSRVLGAEDELSPLYPSLDEISIPPEPKPLGLAFTFDLCFPVLVIFGILSAAMFSAGRNPFQMFSLYTPRFKRAPQRAIRARGFIINVNAIASSIAAAAQGQGGRTTDKKTGKKKLNRPKKLGAKIKGLKSAMGSIKEIRKSVRQARAGKGFRPSQVRGGGEDEGGKGSEKVNVSGDERLAAEGAGYTLNWMAETGVGLSPKLTARALGSTLGSALLARILGRYAFTSWIVYGGGRTKVVENKDGSKSVVPTGFRGLRNIFEGRLKTKAAGEIALNCDAAIKNINWQDNIRESILEGKDKITVSYTDVDGNRVTRTFSNDKDGRKEALALRGDVLQPTIIVMNAAAGLWARTNLSPGSSVLEAMEALREKGKGRFRLTVEKDGKEATVPFSLDAMRAEGKKKYADKLLGVTPKVLPPAQTVEKDKGALSKDAKFVKYVESFEKGANQLGTKGAEKKHQVMNADSLSRAALVLETAEERHGAEFVANDPMLSRLAKALNNASEASVRNAMPGEQAQSMAAFRNYSRALTASIAIDGGNTGLISAYSHSLANSVAEAGAGGAPPSRVDLLVAAAVLEKADGGFGPKKGRPQRMMESPELSSLANSLVAGGQAHAAGAPPEYKTQALELQLYSASVAGTIAAKGNNEYLAGRAVDSLASGTAASKSYLEQSAPADIRTADETQKSLANTLAGFSGEADPAQYKSARELEALSRNKILEQANDLSVFGVKDDGSMEYMIQQGGYAASAAGEKYAEEKRDQYLPSVVGAHVSEEKIESSMDKAAFNSLSASGNKEASKLAEECRARAAAELYPRTLREDQVGAAPGAPKGREQLAPSEQDKVAERAGQLARKELSRREERAMGIDEDSLKIKASQDILNEMPADSPLRKSLDSMANSALLEDIHRDKFEPSDTTKAQEKAQEEAADRARRESAPLIERWKQMEPGSRPPDADSNEGRLKEINEIARQRLESQFYAPAGGPDTPPSGDAAPKPNAEQYMKEKEEYLAASNPNLMPGSVSGFNADAFKQMHDAASDVITSEPPKAADSIGRREARQAGLESPQVYDDQRYRTGVAGSTSRYQEHEKRMEQWGRPPETPKAEAPKAEEYKAPQPPPQPEIKPQEPKPVETPKPQELPKQPEYKAEEIKPEPVEITPDYSQPPPKVEQPKPRKPAAQPKPKTPETPQVMDFAKPPAPAEKPKPRKRQEPSTPPGTKEVGQAPPPIARAKKARKEVGSFLERLRNRRKKKGEGGEESA